MEKSNKTPSLSREEPTVAGRREKQLGGSFTHHIYSPTASVLSAPTSIISTAWSRALPSTKALTSGSIFARTVSSNSPPALSKGISSSTSPALRRFANTTGAIMPAVPSLHCVNASNSLGVSRVSFRDRCPLADSPVRRLSLLPM